MNTNTILFCNLPFRPEPNQVFFIENGYDEDVNDLIRAVYLRLKAKFDRAGMDFYYMPYLLSEHDIEAKLRYYAPYLSSQPLVGEVRSDAFAPYISDEDQRKRLKPSLIFGATREGYAGDVRFRQVALSDVDFVSSAAMDALVHLISQRLAASCGVDADMAPISPCLASVPMEDKSECLLSQEFLEPSAESAMPVSAEETAEKQSFIATEDVLRELRMTVQKLRLEGVSLMAIHEFIDKQEPLSRMIVTPDYRIFLPDYNGMEIEMGALPKAIYFLYLRYPEGIIYKHMQDYYTELLNIYRQLRPCTDEARLNLTITKVVNPLGNALNENLARIRKAFVEKFDEHLAINYIVTGERGSRYAIPLDRDLVVWEE